MSRATLDRVSMRLENLEKSREFDIGQGSPGNCDLPVVCYCRKINVSRVLLSKVDIPKIDCQ